MKTEQDAQTGTDVQNGSVEPIRIQPPGCTPDNNPARPKKIGGRVKFINQTGGGITITLEKEIFEEKGNPYSLAAHANETYRVDSNEVAVGEKIDYSVDGKECSKQEKEYNPESTTVLHATLAPRMIIV